MRSLAFCLAPVLIVAASHVLAETRTVWSPVIAVPKTHFPVEDSQPACSDPRSPSQLVAAYAGEVANGLDKSSAARSALTAGAPDEVNGDEARLLAPVTTVIAEKAITTSPDNPKKRDARQSTGNCAPVCVVLPADVGLGDKALTVMGWVAAKSNADFTRVGFGSWGADLAGANFSTEEAFAPLQNGHYLVYCRIFENWSNEDDRRAKISVEYAP